jgi:hypothetical protein
MTWIPDLTPEELATFDPDLIAFLQDQTLWQEWDRVIVPQNKLLWSYFTEALGRPAFMSGVKRVAESEEWQKFEGAWRAPDGYKSWLGGTKYADEWFKDRGTEFVKQVSDTDRKRLKNLLVKHWGVGEKKFARLIKDEYLFSPARARAIYHEETTNTHEAGSYMFAYKNGGKWKRWMAGQLNACPICQKLNGQTRPIEQPFSTGYMWAHAHIGDRCTTVYFVESPAT